MKTPLRRAALTILLSSLAIPLAMAQQTQTTARTAPAASDGRGASFEGEAVFFERIALPPGAKLHVSLVGRVAGAEYLPLSSGVFPARNGATPFNFSLAPSDLPPGPYRLQAWIVADNRLFMQGRDPQTTVADLTKPAQIRLKIVPAPQNIDGFGDGRPFPAAPNPAVPNPAAPLAAPTAKTTLKVTVSKLDRRALSPDSQLEVQLLDVSLADAPSQLVVGAVGQLEGGQLPKTLELTLLPGDLLPRRRYSLSARITENRKLTYITDRITEVTPENVGQGFELRVVAVK